MTADFEDLPSYPSARTCPLHPAPEYGALREREPVSRVRTRNGSWAWLVTRHADVHAVLTDPSFSSVPTLPGFPHLRQLPEKPPDPGIFMSMDPPEHTRYRRMLTSEFTVRRIEALRPVIAGIVEQRIDELVAAGPGADLVALVARPVTTLVICELLGVPYADQEFFSSRTQLQLDRSSRPRDVVRAVAELDEYLDRLVTAKEQQPADDLISRLVLARVRTGELTHDELTGFGRFLLVAGQETTAGAIALGVLLLLDEPGRWAALGADPELVPAAVEEVLRHTSVVQHGVVRAVVADVTVGGQLMRAGEGVIVSLAAANRDPAVFADPDRFDPQRTDGQHLAFGFGVHQCLAHLLARAEITETLRALAARLPTLRLLRGADQLEYRHELAVYGVAELPVTWGISG